jgi:hypothetical protein
MLTLLVSLAHALPAAEAPEEPESPEASPSDSDEPAEVVPEPDPIDPLLGRVYKPKRDWQPRPGSKYWELEVLYSKHQHAECAALAEKLYEETGDPHLTLYIARSWFQHLEGNDAYDSKQRLEIYQKNLEVLEEGIAKAPDDVHLKFAYGVLYGRIGTTRGVLASLRSADDIENAWLAAANSDYRYGSINLQEELPCDAFLALGIFYRLVPDSWLVKAISGTRGDLDKSLDMQQKGLACSGPRIRNYKELAATQMCIGTKRNQPEMIQAGRDSVNAYLAIEPKNQAEIVDIKHGIMLLQDPEAACGYSRDGQQDLDEAKIEK